MASSRERYNNIVASEKTTTVSARDRYNALKQIENANDRLVSAVNFINNNAGISSDANTDGSTDIRDVVRSKNITNQATEHINAINDIRSAYDVLERYSKQRGGSLAGYQENSKNLKELKELLTGAKQYGEENSKLLKDVLSGAYAKRLATEQTVQMLESIDTSSPTVFAKQQQYKQNNPNLYSVMGGRAYNPIPSVNPTQLTKEDLEKVQTAQAWDKARQEVISKKSASGTQTKKAQTSGLPTHEEVIQYIVSSAMSPEERNALQSAKNKYTFTAFLLNPENKNNDAKPDGVIGKLNVFANRSNNLVGNYTDEEKKAINKYAQLFALYTNADTPEDAFSTVARLTGDKKNVKAYQEAELVNRMQALAVEQAIKLPGTNIDVPFLRDIVDLGVRVKRANMYTAYNNLSPESQEGYLRANIISPLEGEKFIEAHEDEIIYNRALKLYNEAINGNGIQRASAQLGIFIDAGIESGLGGLAKGFLMAVGETPEAEPMSINQTANNMLSQYYADNNKRLSKVIQDVVVNAVQNQSVAIGGTLIGIATGNPMAGNIAGNILFGVSVFGNNYEDAVRNGAESQNATVYALSTAALETSLGIALGAIPGAKGFLTGTVLSDISKKVANPAAKFILKMTARYAGESIEEGLQQAIDPFLRNAMLNEKNDTIFNSKSAWKDVGYSSIIGGLSALLLSGGATISEIQTEKQTESYGQAFKQFSDEYDVSVKDLAKYAKEISEEKSELYKTADGILSGKLEESDYNVGLLYTGAVKEIYDAGRVVTELVGNKVMNTENGISDLIAQYDEVTERGFEFPDIVKLQVDAVRRKQESGSEVSAYEVGRMARTIPLYAARAAIETAIAQDSELQSTANNESAITPNEEATVENLADQAQEVDKVSVAENKSIGFTEPSTKDIYREPTAEERYEAVLGKRKTAKQRHILDVAKALDKNLKVVFVPKNSNVLNDKNGKYVFNTNTMYLAEDLDVVESYSEVFKHEFMHRLELKKAYDGFKAYLFNKSDAFERYAQTRMAYDDKKKERGTIERTKEDAINDLINMYLDNFKGDKKIPQSVRDNFTREKAEREAVADFVARTLFKGNTAKLRVALSEDLESLVNMETDLELFEEMAKNDRNLLQKIIDAIRDFINDIKGVPQFKDLEQDLRYIEERLTRVYNSADMINGRSNIDNEVYDIVALENGNTYVKASRNIITGTTIKQQRAQITNFFKKLLKNKPSIDIPTIEGDILTLTMKDTEDKARDNFGTVNGQPVKLSKEEFAVKLRIESHIDEIAETAIKKNKPLTPDVKNHDFAKDGFEYRTAYFEDFDGKYYKIDFSIGHNGTVATVYNIGKIKEDVPPSAKIIAVVGSQALDSSSSTDIIRNKNENVNKNSSNESYFSDNFTTSKDSDGKQLTKAQEVFFKDSASVDDNGNLLVMYQGSQEEFNEFDRKKSSPFNLYGRGFYFTSSKSHAAQYGNVTRAYYLNIKNPVPTYKGDSIITKQQIKKYLEVVAENEDYSIENYGTYDINKIVDSVYGKSDYAMLQDISATAIGDLVEAIELFNKVNGTKFDGLILATETIIFNSEQAKLTTNLNPTESKDIRYSSDNLDIDYLKAVEKGDLETAQRMVDEVAKANGYTQKLYHGTNKFGFTKIDVSNSDDGISFFATDTEETAETYSSGVKKKRISDASESLPDGDIEEVQDEIKSLTSRLSEWCNRNLGIQGWVDYDYFKSKLEDCFYELEIGTPVDSVISSFNGFCDELYFSFEDNYYQGNYEDNPYLDEEDYLSWEDWQESKEADDLSDEYWNNITQITAKFKALDTSANSGVYDLYANTEGMLVVDAKGENWNRLPDPRDADGKLGLSGEFNFRMFTTRDYAQYGKAEGYRGVIFKNMKDSGDGSYVKPTTVYIFFNPQEQVKSADPVTYDDNGNVIPLSERFNDDDVDIRYSSDNISELQRDLYNRHRNGELTDEEYVEETDKLWEKANETYGTLPKGEKAKIDANVPAAVAKDKPTERFIRGIIETDTLKGEALKGMEERTLLGDFSYKVVSDEKAIKTANVAFENGTAESIWEDTVNVGTGITKNKIAIGEALLTNAIKENNTFEILKYSAELADIFTRAGQVVQAARLLKKMTGAGRLVSLQRTVKTLNKDLIKKYGEEFPPIKISEESAKRLADAKTVIGIEQAYQEILQEVADQMPVTFMDKWNAWRYFAMLANPKTHIRNLIGNVIFVPTVRIKDAIAAGIEAATIEDKSKRTKSLVIKKEYRDFAKKDSSRKDVKELLRGNKYNDKTAISEKQKIFKTEVLNFLTEFNSNALEAEDMWAKNKHYIHALAGFLQARGVDLNNVSNKVLDEARIYAVKEARKATFNDVSAFADAIQRFANKNLAANLLVEGVLPFKRTPINIVKRGIEYSPIGLIKTIAKGILDVKKGKITATEFIDGLASGLTGTGILLAGMLLNSLGYVVGGEDDDDKSQFEKLLGKQEYSVEFLGSSYTIDWAAPACIPFFIGVEIMNSVNENEGFEFSQFFNAVWNSLEPITNLSMLSGIQSVIESTRYADNTQTFSAIAIDSLTSYAMQGIPSLSGAIARTIDPTQRSWYIDKNDKWLDTTAQTVKNNLQSKIPGLTYTQTAKIDAWGRKVSRGGTAERILENFVSPGYYSKINYDEVEQELLRINSVTGESIFPKSASKSFEVNGETKHLSAKEWELYAILKGQYSYKYIKEFKESKYYDKLDDFERAEVIKDLYSFANAKAKSEVSDYDIFSISTYKTAAKYDKNNKLIPYYVSKAIEYVRKKRKEEKE